MPLVDGPRSRRRLRDNRNRRDWQCDEEGAIRVMAENNWWCAVAQACETTLRRLEPLEAADSTSIGRD